MHDVTFARGRLPREFEDCHEQSRAGAAPYLLPLVDKDLPALYALQFENTALELGVVFQFLAHFVFIIGIDDQHRATLIS